MKLILENLRNHRERLKQISTELKIDGNIKTHGLRKYYETQLNTLGNVRFKTHLVGAEPNYRDDTYDTNLKNIKWFYENWSKAEKVICVDCILIDNTDKMVEELKQENFELRSTISVLSKDMDGLKSKFRILELAIKQGLLIDTFPDGVESGSPNDEPIVKFNQKNR